MIFFTRFNILTTKIRNAGVKDKKIRNDGVKDKNRSYLTNKK